MSESLPHDLPPLITRYRRRKAFGTVLAALVLGTTLGISWYYFVRAPSPRSVCDHIEGLRRQFPQDARGLEDAVAPLAVSGSPRPPAHSTDQLCMWYFTTKEKEQGLVDYGRLARCVTFADTPRALYGCIY